MGFTASGSGFGVMRFGFRSRRIVGLTVSSQGLAGARDAKVIRAFAEFYVARGNVVCADVHSPLAARSYHRLMFGLCISLTLYTCLSFCIYTYFYLRRAQIVESPLTSPQESGVHIATGE